jgi:hypothetical protein
MAYSGLETLFQNMGPAFAGTVAGEREGMAQGLDALMAQKHAEEIRAAQQTYGQKELTNPLERTKMGLENTGLGLKNTREQQGIDLTTATQPGEISKTNAENESAVYGSKLKQLANIRNIITEGTANLGTGLEGELNKQKFLESGAVPPGIMYDRIKATPVEQLPKIMADLNSSIARTSAAYLQAIDAANISAESHKYAADQGYKGHQLTSNATKYAADKAYDKAIAVQELKNEMDQLKAEHKLANQKLAAKDIEGSLLAIPEAQRTPEQKQALAEVKQILNIRSASAMGIDLSSLGGSLKSNADKVKTPESGVTKNGVKWKQVGQPTE